MIASILSAIAQMFGLLGIGWISDRLKIISGNEVSRIARLVFDILFPCLIFNSVVRGLEIGRLAELWVLPVIAFSFMLLGYLLGFLFRIGLKNKCPDIARVFHHLCAINNYGFLPIFIIQNSMPPDALALFFLFNLGSTIGFWTIGVLSLGGSNNVKAAARQLYSPPLVSLLIALVVTLAGGRDWIPVFLLDTISKAGSIAVPLILISIGASMAKSFRKEYFQDIAYLTTIRLIVLPAIKISLISLFPLPEDIHGICILVALMPASATAVIMTRLYGGSSEFAASGTLITTLLSAITIPLGIWWLLQT